MRRDRLVLGGMWAASAGLLAFGTTRVKEWTVMTDELLYAKLAQHIAETGSPLPVLHGEHVGFLGVVYSIVLSPFYGLLDPVAAYDAGHVVNAVLFTSTAIPVYLLTRRLVAREWALVVALLAVAVPWATHAGTLMSESAAYPAFMWAFAACHWALVQPSPRRDAWAIGALALAFFTRPQFLVLAPVLPLAALVVDGPRRALDRHRVLAGACVAALLVVIPLAALGETHRLLGQYGVTATEGSLLPAGVWKSAALHIDLIAIGLGVVPFVLGAGWIYASLRVADRAARAFAALAAFALPLVALETASFDLRFGGGFVRDRYAFYIAPLLLVAAAAALAGRLPLWGIAAAGVFFGTTVPFGEFQRIAGFWNDSPLSVLNGIFRGTGLPPGVFVELVGIVLAAICLGFAWLPRPPVLLATAVFTFAFGASVAGYGFERLLTSHATSGFPVTGQDRVRDWVDRAVGDDSVAALAYPISRAWGQSAVIWWDVEFWSRSPRRAFVSTNGRFTYDPFPVERVRLGPDGVVPRTDDAPKYMLAAPGDSRFGFAGKQVAANAGLVLYKVKRPWRATWASRGLDADGFARPGQAAAIRVFAPGGSNELVRLKVTIDVPPEAPGEVRYHIGKGTGGALPGTRASLEQGVCVPEGGHTDVPFRSDRAATIEGPPFGPEPGPTREVGVVLSGVEVKPTGEECTP